MKGILLVHKQIKKTSFSIIHLLRKITKEKKIGHSGTLDPFATGLMVILIGKEFTKRASFFQSYDKKYYAKIYLGKISSTLDSEGEIKKVSKKIPEKKEIIEAAKCFQGEIKQIPPMFSAKKINGKKLYKLARKNIEIERKPIDIKIKTNILYYKYPYLELQIRCSSGTYIRSIADDIGKKLSCGAYLSKLVRTDIGPFHIKNSILQKDLFNKDLSIEKYLIQDF